jgi:hypothetical protein
VRAWPLLLLLLLAPTSAEAGPWTRDQGHFYLNVNYSRIAARRLFALDYSLQPDPAPSDPIYTQHALGLYGEVGIVSRWLTASVEGQLYRHNRIDEAVTEGMGDLRVGLWTGLVTAPVRLTAALLVGLPTGDPAPRAGDGADLRARRNACILPTGDGEVDVETRLSFGHSFGGKGRYPLLHYVVAEAGYWARNAPYRTCQDLLGGPAAGAQRREGFFDAFTYKAELGIKLPYKFIERFWFIVRLSGVESFARTEDLQFRDAPLTGLGDGVTYTAYGFDVAGRLWRGLGASIGLDSAFRARLVPAGANLRVALSYEY